MENSNRKVWLTIISVTVLVVAGYRLIFGSTGKPKLPDTYTAYGICLACKQEATILHQKDDPQPFLCQGCGEQAVYTWWYCNDCRYRFIPELIRTPGEPPHPTPYPTCTHCSCNSVSGWDPENPDQARGHDAKLPKWP